MPHLSPPTLTHAEQRAILRDRGPAPVSPPRLPSGARALLLLVQPPQPSRSLRRRYPDEIYHRQRPACRTPASSLAFDGPVDPAALLPKLSSEGSPESSRESRRRNSLTRDSSHLDADQPLMLQRRPHHNSGDPRSKRNCRTDAQQDPEGASPSGLQNRLTSPSFAGRPQRPPRKSHDYQYPRRVESEAGCPLSAHRVTEGSCQATGRARPSCDPVPEADLCRQRSIGIDDRRDKHEDCYQQRLARAVPSCRSRQQ